MNEYKGYYSSNFKCRIMDIQSVKEHIDELNISEITLDGVIVFPDKRILMCDEENPIVFTDNVYYRSTICIDKSYFDKNKKEMLELVSFICKNTKKSRIKLPERDLIRDEVIDAIISNPNIKTVTLGSETDKVILTEELYEKFKNSNIESVNTHGVVDSLKENFDTLVGYNANRYLIGYYCYNELQSQKKISLSKPLSEDEIENLKYVKEDIKISFCSKDYKNTFKCINRLRECGHTGLISIEIEDKNSLNNFIFGNINEVKYSENIEVYLSGNVYSLSDYIKYERKLIELILPAINYSPFEKYLYAYNVVKKFKKYKENNEDKTSARDLYQIFDNDYMVCVAYSKLLGDLLDKLGIENYDYSVSVDVGLDGIPNEAKPLPDFIYDEKTGELKELQTEAAGHARRRVHLVDPKYGIDGYYFTDPTWDNNMEHDTYNYALMTQEEYIGMDRYNYYSTGSVTELFFIHSLEEFYLKINIYLDKNRRKTEIDVIKSLLSVFKEIDNEFYLYLINKYQEIERYSKEFTKDEIQNILLDMGERIIQKGNNIVDGHIFKEGITTLYRDIEGLAGEELETKVNEIMEYNKKRHKICFPTRYKVDKDENKMVILNVNNKFDLEEQPNLGM